MIDIDPALGEEIAELLVALGGYLDANGVPQDSYAVGPSARLADAPYRFGYPVPTSFKTRPAQVSFPAADGRHELITDFSSGRTLLAALLTLDPEHRWTGMAVDASAETVLFGFGIPASDHVFPSVPSQVDRSFVIPEKGGFAFGYMDIRPPAMLISRSAKAAPPAVHLALEQRAQEANLFAALAEHLPEFP